MKEFWYNLAPWLSIIAIALIQPLTNFVINWQNIRQKRKEQHYETEVMAYREFARTYGYLRFNNSDKNYWDFAGAANQVAIMCKDKNTRKLIFDLLELMKTNHYPTDITDQLFQKCIQILSCKVK